MFLQFYKLWGGVGTPSASQGIPWGMEIIIMMWIGTEAAPALQGSRFLGRVLLYRARVWESWGECTFRGSRLVIARPRPIQVRDFHILGLHEKHVYSIWWKSHMEGFGSIDSRIKRLSSSQREWWIETNTSSRYQDRYLVHKYARHKELYVFLMSTK